MSSKKPSGVQFPPLKKLFTKAVKDPLDDVEVEEDRVRPDIVLENLILRSAVGVLDEFLAASLDVFEEQQRITRHGSLPSRRTA